MEKQQPIDGHQEPHIAPVVLGARYWLKEFVNVKDTPEHIAEKLTLSGSEAGIASKGSTRHV